MTKASEKGHLTLAKCGRACLTNVAPEIYDFGGRNQIKFVLRQAALVQAQIFIYGSNRLNGSNCLRGIAEFDAFTSTACHCIP
ncbi:MAG: hypothetical protein D6778_07890 [Nitrospirae bacterium]|nr:MAG: hypothetical protein D6778_07890 [Nitrospirota bacterium]